MKNPDMMDHIYEHGIEAFLAQDNVELFYTDNGYPEFIIEVKKDSGEFAAFINVYESTTHDAETKMPCDCEPYLSAYIKWDSCCHFHFCDLSFGDENGYLHLCGAEYIKQHFAVIKRVYAKAFEVMGRQPEPDEVLD